MRVPALGRSGALVARSEERLLELLAGSGFGHGHIGEQHRAVDRDVPRELRVRLDEQRIAPGKLAEPGERGRFERNPEGSRGFGDRRPLGLVIEAADGANIEEALGVGLRIGEHTADGRQACPGDQDRELELRGPGVDFVVLGVGINVNQTEFPAEIPNPGSLAMTRGPRDRAVLLAALVPAMLSRVADVPGGNAEILDAWRARSATLGRVVQVGELRGEAVDLSPEGALLLRTAEGLQTVLAGDVQLVG